METFILAKLIATSSADRMFLVPYHRECRNRSVHHYTLHPGKSGNCRAEAYREKVRTIVSMILQQAVGLGVLGFMIGKISATFWAPFFPKFVLLEARDAVTGFAAVIVMCVLASILAIRAALKVDPAEAIGG
jgi:putative ABC transport system permease protein